MSRVPRASFRRGPDLLLAFTIFNYFRFQNFKGWQERLPFALLGFSEMVRSKRMFCDLCWNDTRITVEQRGNDETKQVIEAALGLFCDRAQKAFYVQELSSDSKRSRSGWRLSSSLTAEGSANPELMRYMKDLFEGELATIASRTGAINRVQVDLISEEFEAKIHIGRGD
ncbi:MAG: hypothetical protein K1X75_16255 [Leptospirales bacterium]|nr:hypothetical protein [Leptospirales bacterium]